MNNNKSMYKIVLIGDSGVGKSSLAYWLLQNRRCLDFSSTIGAAYMVKDIQIPILSKDGILEDKEIKLQIWDTAGQERYRSIAKMYYKNTAGCVCVFDLTNRESFVNLNYWLKDYREITYGKNTAMIIVANKADIPKSSWQVTEDDIIKLSEANSCNYVYTSCMDGLGIKNAFQILGISVYNRDTVTESGNDIMVNEEKTGIITDLANRTKNIYNKDKCCF